MNKKKNEKEEEGGIGLVGGILIGVGALIAGIIGKTIYDEITKEKGDEKNTEEVEKEKEQKEIEKFYQEQKNTTTDEPQSTLDSFICPITQEIMTDPVITPDGISYEKEAIKNWLQKNKYDPITKNPLNNDSLIQNYALKNAIDDYQNQIQSSKISSSK